MKKLFSILVAALFAANLSAITVRDICGRFDGNLYIAGSLYPSKTVYLLPGAVDSTVTFVLPDFMYGAGKLGHIVLPNIPMSAEGQLTMENGTLYLDSISERAMITILNGLEDGGVTYNSIVSTDGAQVILSIQAPSLPEPIFVLFQGQAIRNRNYALVNGGFEGEWTNYEPEGWHSFYTATGLMKDFIVNNYQFTPSGDVRPGSTGSRSALLSSTMALGVKANGNLTNGQINAGSSTADDAAGNYNFSDPTNTGYCTPFHGRPDSIVFWAKYLPADRNYANEVNKARMNAVITTNARYQDPESGSFGEAKIASATVNYSATSEMGWQRLSVPFEYQTGGEAAYILTTFSTNFTPGGGSSYTTGGAFSKTNVLDTVYLDDVELVYNRTLASFRMDGEAVAFANGVAEVETDYCDDCVKYATTAEGQSAQCFQAFDAVHRCVFVYVIADNYAQSGAYSLYRVDFRDSETDDLIPLTPEGISNTSIDRRPATRKILRNGMLLIERDGRLYTVQGLCVR